MESIYFGEETAISAIQALAEDKYGEYGGYAQQYLYFAKTNEIGKNTRKKRNNEKVQENICIPGKISLTICLHTVIKMTNI